MFIFFQGFQHIRQNIFHIICIFKELFQYNFIFIDRDQIQAEICCGWMVKDLAKSLRIYTQTPNTIEVCSCDVSMDLTQ